MIILSLSLQLASAAQMYGDQIRSFEPYRACILSKAVDLARSDSPVEVLKGVAKSECRTAYAGAAADAALDEASLTISKASGEIPQTESYSPIKHLDQLERELSEDFAAAVVRARLRKH